MIKKPFAHKHFNHAELELQKALENHRPGRLVGIVGMPGSGKTFLRNLVLRRVVGAPESWGVGKLAVTEVMALLDINSKFSAKGFAARSHRSVLLPDLRALYRDTSDEIQEAYLLSLRNAEDAWKQSRATASTTETKYWQAFAEAAIDRRLQYFAVEHAAAIGRPPKDEEPRNHMWNLMSIMEQVGCVGILNLIPEGYALWEGRPEIAERMDRIFILPYDLNDEAELTEFAGMVLHVAANYELESIEVIKRRIVEIGIATATGMRAVEKLFSDAAVKAQNRGCSMIGDDDLMRAMETEEHIAALWDQVRLLKRISKPASESQLLDIHKKFLTEVK